MGEEEKRKAQADLDKHKKLRTRDADYQTVLEDYEQALLTVPNRKDSLEVLSAIYSGAPEIKVDPTI